MNTSNAELRIGHLPDSCCLLAEEGLTGARRSVKKHATVDDVHSSESLIELGVELGQEEIFHYKFDLSAHTSKAKMSVPFRLWSNSLESLCYQLLRSFLIVFLFLFILVLLEFVSGKFERTVNLDGSLFSVVYVLVGNVNEGLNRLDLRKFGARQLCHSFIVKQLNTRDLYLNFVAADVDGDVSLN